MGRGLRFLAGASGSLAAGSVTTTEILDGTIVDADVSSSAAIAGSKISPTATINSQTASYTAVLADNGKVVTMTVASGNTFTVPPNSSVAFPVGAWIEVMQLGAGQTTLTPGAAVTLSERETKLKLAGQFSTARLFKTATDTWIVSGDVSA